MRLLSKSTEKISGRVRNIMSVNVWNTSVSDSPQQTPLWPPKEFLFSFVKLNACLNLWGEVPVRIAE